MSGGDFDTTQMRLVAAFGREVIPAARPELGSLPELIHVAFVSGEALIRTTWRGSVVHNVPGCRDIGDNGYYVARRAWEELAELNTFSDLAEPRTCNLEHRRKVAAVYEEAKRLGLPTRHAVCSALRITTVTAGNDINRCARDGLLKLVRPHNSVYVGTAS
jgi:hypothetical protein